MVQPKNKKTKQKNHRDKLRDHGRKENVLLYIPLIALFFYFLNKGSHILVLHWASHTLKPALLKTTVQPPISRMTKLRLEDIVPKITVSRPGSTAQVQLWASAFSAILAAVKKKKNPQTNKKPN